MKTYQNRVVLFLDILGFQKIIDETVVKDKDQEDEIHHLFEALQIIREEVSKENKGTSKVVTQFSDSIVVSFQVDDSKEVRPFFKNILTIIIKLINRNIICRGAISYGKLIHTENIVFGPALIDAYLTESSAAFYPRVILDKTVIDSLTHSEKDKSWGNLSKWVIENQILQTLNKDTDDKLYLDYFQGSLTVFRDSSVSDYFLNLRKIIIAGFGYETPNIKAKYGWMKNKFNAFLDNLDVFQYKTGAYFNYVTELRKIDRIK